MKLLLYDHGENTWLAELLAVKHTVGYYSPRTTHYFDSAPGQLPGIEKVTNFEQARDDADVICLFGSNKFDDSNLVEDLLINHGTVFGAGRDAKLEWDRSIIMQRIPDTKVVHGVLSLIQVLQTHKKQVVKVSGYRDVETFLHDDWKSTIEQHLGKVLAAYGTDPNIEFIVTPQIDDPAEVGVDDLYCKGRPANLRAYGYESKDSAYIGQIVLGTSLPHKLDQRQAITSSTFASVEYRAFRATDVTMRVPYPPGPALAVGYPNIDDFIVSAAEGVQLNLRGLHNYIYALPLYSSYAEQHPVEVSCDSANRAFLKLSRHYRRGDRVYVAPNEDGYLGCVAYSASGLVEGVNMTKLIAEKVSCKGLTYNASALDTILDKTIPIGRTNGIPF